MSALFPQIQPEFKLPKQSGIYTFASSLRYREIQPSTTSAHWGQEVIICPEQVRASAQGFILDNSCYFLHKKRYLSLCWVKIEWKMGTCGRDGFYPRKRRNERRGLAECGVTELWDDTGMVGDWFHPAAASRPFVPHPLLVLAAQKYDSWHYLWFIWAWKEANWQFQR